MKDDLIFFQIDDNLNLIQMEYDLNILANGRQPKKKIMQPKRIKIKRMVVAPLRVTLYRILILSIKLLHIWLEWSSDHHRMNLWQTDLMPTMKKSMEHCVKNIICTRWRKYSEGHLLYVNSNTRVNKEMIYFHIKITLNYFKIIIVLLFTLPMMFVLV